MKLRPTTLTFPLPSHPAIFFALGSLITIFFATTSIAQPSDPKVIEASGTDYTQVLRSMSIEQLINLEVVSAAKKIQKVSQAAAAIFVITQEDIRRSGATAIPELLRMVPGVSVSRINANQWAISSRGFHARFANKLLVLIDGRTVYTPLFSGTFWDAQDTLLEDIERIEVIRGPGATLWGANAVNGVINIITKNARDTEGGQVSAGGGTKERGFASVRYGESMGDSTFYRAYGKYFNRDNFVQPGGSPSDDAWQSAQSGFRMDSKLNDEDKLTLQGDAYYTEEGLTTTMPSLSPALTETNSRDTYANGANLLTRWSRQLSKSSDMQLQMYYDLVNRDDLLVNQEYNTFDLDFQHRFLLTPAHEILWGAGYRFYRDNLDGTTSVSFDPDTRDVNSITWFIQDEISLTDTFGFIVGSKFEQNEFTDLEIQPNARFIYSPTESQSTWAAVSRAVRTPARSEEDVQFHLTSFPTETGLPGLAVLSGNKDFDSEELLAFEVGYRAQVEKNLSFDIATFYNDYDRLFSVEQNSAPAFQPSPSPHIELPILFDNKKNGQTYGAEFVTDWRAYDWWRIVGSYSYVYVAIQTDPESNDSVGEKGDTPNHQFLIRSWFDLPWNTELDAALRFVDTLENLSPSYSALDLRFGWHPRKNLEVAVIGQNLLQESHLEFTSRQLITQVTEIERGVFGKVTWLF